MGKKQNVSTDVRRIMFEDLCYPEEIGTDTTTAWYVPTASDDSYGTGGFQYLTNLCTLSDFPYLFNTFDDAILTAAGYYHRQAYPYPYKQELRDAENRIPIPIEDTFEYLESKVMRFD